MNTRLGLAFVTLSLCLVHASAQRLPSLDSLRRQIIPTPQEVRPGSGLFRFSSSTKIVMGTGLQGEDRSAADRLNDAIEEGGRGRLRVVTEASLRKISSGSVYLASPRSVYAKKLLSQRPELLISAMAAEGYLLDIGPEMITIIAESPRGRFYGMMSLLQLLAVENRSLFAPGVMIRDWPLQRMRGITDDISRGQVSTIDNFKKIIRFCGEHKLNVYSPYIEDMFIFKNHPLIGKGRGALTAAQIRELDAYAKLYQVELIPTFETLGHWENILLLPEYQQYAEFPGAHTLNVSDERIYTMLDEMIGELAGAFSSPYFNMAADESWDVGLGVNKARVDASDLATVHAEHYRRLFDILKKHNKMPMMYGDVILNHPDILSKIPKDVVIVDWHYGAADSYSSPQTFRSAGFPFVVCPAVWNFTGPFPNYLNAFVNIQNLNRDGYRNGSLGLLTSNWNDNGGGAFRELNYLGYAWTAECAWLPEQAKVSGFTKRFFRRFFGSEDASVMASAVYSILSDPLHQMMWYDLWRHPMLPLRPNPIPALLRIQSVQSSQPVVMDLIERGQKASARNTDHWRVLSFIAKQAGWYGERMKYGEQIKALSQSVSPGTSADSVNREAERLAEIVVKELPALRAEFKEIWSVTNRPEGLEWMVERYDRQEAYWKELIAGYARGTVWVDPLIQSQWIYHPSGNPGSRDSAAQQVRRAYFAASITLPRVLAGRVQLMADTRARMWVNGREAGEVLARRSLSLSVELQRAKIFDVTPYLVEGTNIVSVEAENYNRNGSAGVNVYGEFTRLDSAVVAMGSDTTWGVADLAPAKWPIVAPGLTPTTKAKSVPYPSPVVRPDLWTGRTSWVER